jgi:hypothetical protein
MLQPCHVTLSERAPRISKAPPASDVNTSTTHLPEATPLAQLWLHARRSYSRQGSQPVYLCSILIKHQVIILGDSGVGKTSLMNQYVCLECPDRRCALIHAVTGQQKVQRKLQSDDRRRLPHKRGPRRRPTGDDASPSPENKVCKRLY